MTQKQFKEALLRGQGRCLQAIQSDPAKYYSIVLWACSHTVAFDAQCEGTRAWFVYQLISCYEDKEPFLKAAISGLQKATSDGGWRVLYLAELLCQFASDGELAAESTLWDKYKELYHALLTKRKAPDGIFPERDNFAMLCQVLADSKVSMVRIAEDIGRLYRTKDFYDGYDFDWLFNTKAKRYMGTLKKQAQKSPNVSAYLQYSKAKEEEAAKKRQNRRADPERYMQGRMLSVWLRNKADAETVQKYADAYLMQKDPIKRANALVAFSRCPFPGDPETVIQDARSDCEPLRNAAWEALENIRHPSVRGFAMEQLPYCTEMVIPILILNYQSQDEEMLVTLIKSIPVDFECNTNWHGIHGDILAMEDRKLKAPPALLWHIYETTFCSCCREYALLQMGKRRLLSTEILEECLLDSNDDIRKYASKCLKRRQHQTQLPEK